MGSAACAPGGGEPVPAPVPAEASSLDEELPALAPGDRAAADRLFAAAQAQRDALRRTQAIALFEQALEADPTHLGARLDLGFLLLEPEAGVVPGKALRQFRLARTLAPDAARALAGEGIARQEVGDLERAEELLRRALAALPPGARERGETAVALGRVLHAGGRLEEAARAFEEARAALATAPERKRLARALVHHAQLQRDRGDEAGAEGLLREAIALDRRHVQAHYQLARLLARRGAPEEAERLLGIYEILRQMHDQATQDPDRRFVQDHARRIALWQELIATYPEHVRARVEFVRELLDMGRFEAAIEEVRGEVESRGVDAELCYLLARAQAGRGDLEAARRAHDEMRRLAPQIPPSVTLDILDQWREACAPDASLWQSTLARWLPAR